MPEDEQLGVRRQIRKGVRSLLLRIADIQRELDERCEDRKKWPELERGNDAAVVPPSTGRGTAEDLYRRQGRTYTKFHYVHLEAQQCFEVAEALSPDFASLLKEFKQNTWRTGQESIPPDLVSTQCMKTRLYVARLLEMLEINTQATGSTGPKRKGRPPNNATNSIRNKVREIYQEAKRESIMLPHRDLCDRLAVRKVKLPPNAQWTQCQNWIEAYARFPGRVKRWLSEVLAKSQ